MDSTNQSDRTQQTSLHQQEIDDSPVYTVVTTVAEVTEQSPLEMESLGEVINPDALDSLLDSRNDRSPSVTVTFEYCGQQVTMTGDSIQVEPSAPAEK